MFGFPDEENSIIFLEEMAKRIRKVNINLDYENEDCYEFYTIDPEEEYKIVNRV